MRKENRPRPVMTDDGAPYERLGLEFRDFVIELAQAKGSHSSMTFVAASPFQVVQLKEIIRKLYECSGPGGTGFLNAIGLDSTDDMHEFDHMSASSIIDMLDQAIHSVPFDLRVVLGLAVEETSGTARV